MKPSLKLKLKQTKSKVAKKGNVTLNSAVELAAESDEEMDIRKPLFALVHYVDDRVQLTNEIFRTMSKKGRLNALLPDILRDVPIDELKKLCVEQLQVMSKKRIKSILSGVEMDASSGTEESGNESDNVSTSNPQAADSTGLEATEDGIKGEDRGSDDPTDPCSAEKPSDQNDILQSPEIRIESDMLELHPEDLLDETTVDSRGAFPQNDNDDDDVVIISDSSVRVMDGVADGSSSIARTYLEILELEMRARAIKSLLKSHPIPTGTV